LEICHFALKKMDIGTRTAEVGDLVPEALNWPFINGYVQEGKLGVCRVSSLFEDEIAALEEYEQTGVFTFYDERNGDMTERDMRLTSAVTEAEHIDGSDKNVEDNGLPEAAVVDESSDTTPKLVEQIEAAQDASAAGESFTGEDKDKLAASQAEGGADDAEADEADSYDTWTVAELRTELDNRSVEYKASTNKADLVALLEQDDADSGT